jgi:hypothetical protein
MRKEVLLSVGMVALVRSKNDDRNRNRNRKGKRQEENLRKTQARAGTENQPKDLFDVRGTPYGKCIGRITTQVRVTDAGSKGCGCGVSWWALLPPFRQS